MLKYKIYFSFNLCNYEWCWDKIFYSIDINKSIDNYLEKKRKHLPLDLSNFKYKITIIK